MRKCANLLALVLALVLALGMTASAEDLALNTIQANFDVESYSDVSSELYNEVLGDFAGAYEEAKAAESLSERYAKMAIAEAKLFEAAVMIPMTSRGGNYAISRVAPRTVTSVLWGNDQNRFHNAVIADQILSSEEIAEIRAKWGELRGTGTYEAWVKEYLTGKGYGIVDEYGWPYSSDPKTWDALATSRAADSEAIVNTYDGLYEYDMENTLQPALATEYSVSEDGLTYTFKIREGVSWVDSQGRKVADVKADDFVAGMQHMMDAMGGLEYLVGPDGCGIAGAQAYIDRESTDFTTVGVKALDDYTLEYTLEAPCSFFMTMLGYNCFAPMSRSYYTSQGGQFGDAYSAEDDSYLYGKDPDHIAYCGPYLVTNATAENTIVFKLNDSYWNKDNVNIKTLTWYFNDGTDALKAYNDMKAGILSGTGLSAYSLEQARADGLFQTSGYIAGTDATSFMGFININRNRFDNVNDGKIPSAQTEEEAARTRAALRNVHFRRALIMGMDRGAYNAQDVGEELKFTSLINSYTPGNFISLPEDLTIEIGGEEKTYPAGTYYGQIMQDQLDADSVAAKVWDPEQEGGIGASSGFDGWYSVENAQAELAVALEELAAEGVEISAENPIQIDYPVFINNDRFANRGEAFKQSIEASLNNCVVITKTPCETADEWYYAGYYTDYGYEANYDIYDVSGWGPDYGDPQTYLDTFQDNYAGYMIKCIGIF
ncbi:MAG: peptide ABC transporter substrate-binding protein [Clostridia bacterium]|nr:peptide ABC transporter substrate-binding protein [Clostridia bacterium]